MSEINKHQFSDKKKIIVLITMTIVTLLVAFVCLFLGSSNMSFVESFKALFHMEGASEAQIRIINNIRIPRILAAIIAGAGLSIAGLIMQSCLNNEMASPSTLGVSSGAVFGANLAIIAVAGGFLSTGNNVKNYTDGFNPFATSLLAFIFAVGSVVVILLIARVCKLSTTAIVLLGVAITSFWTALTTILQFSATDVGLSAAVLWSFGDLSRATYQTDLIMFIVIFVAAIFFFIMRYRYNALLSGDSSAKALGINVRWFRIISLLLASLITAVCVSFLGMIGFVGLICPHIVKMVFGENHKFSIPGSIILGSILLLFADTLSRCIGNGSALPVGAITTILGAPFFVFIIIRKRRER